LAARVQKLGDPPLGGRKASRVTPKYGRARDTVTKVKWWWDLAAKKKKKKKKKKTVRNPGDARDYCAKKNQ